MTIRKNIYDYPPEISKALDLAIKYREELPLSLTFKTIKAAKAARRQFYSFRDALYEQPETFPVLALMAPCINFHISKNVLNLYLLPPERDEDEIRRTNGESTLP